METNGVGAASPSSSTSASAGKAGGLSSGDKSAGSANPASFSASKTTTSKSPGKSSSPNKSAVSKSFDAAIKSAKENAAAPTPGPASAPAKTNPGSLPATATVAKDVNTAHEMSQAIATTGSAKTPTTSNSTTENENKTGANQQNKGVVEGFADGFTANASDTWSGIKSVGGSLWGGTKDLASDMVDDPIGTVSSGANAAAGKAKGAAEWTNDVVNNLYNNPKGTINKGWDNTKDTAVGVWNGFSEPYANAYKEGGIPQAIGHGTFDVVRTGIEVVATKGAATATTKAGKLASITAKTTNTVDDAKDIAKMVDKADNRAAKFGKSAKEEKGAKITQYPDGSFRTADGKFASKSGLPAPGTKAAHEFTEYLSEKGFDVVGEEMVVKGALGDRRYDAVVRANNGELWGIEYKSGSATKSRKQDFNDMYINRFGADGVGRLAGERVVGNMTIYLP